MPMHLRLGGTAVPMVSPARVYVCGITPYDVTHLGHASTFVWADVARSVISSTGIEVVTCRNVTDIDDVLTRAAAERGRHYDEFAATQEFEFDRSMRALRVHAPTHFPRASQHVGKVVQLALGLLATGAAYERAGLVYFRGGSVPAAAGLDRATATALSAEYGDRPEDPRRDDPFDVPVWQPSRDGEPSWPSPWGLGRPGWHAECAAMGWSMLGGMVDLLAGGADLAFPHHAYQAAMVEAVTGSRPFARSRLTVGTVSVAGARMAKSTGNLVLVGEVLEHAPAEVLRLLLLDRPWDAAWAYDPAELEKAAQRLDRVRVSAGRTGGSAAGQEQVQAALLDDLDVTRALDLAEVEGGEVAASLLRLLALD